MQELDMQELQRAHYSRLYDIGAHLRHEVRCLTHQAVDLEDGDLDLDILIRLHQSLVLSSVDDSLRDIASKLGEGTVAVTVENEVQVGATVCDIGH